MFPLDDIFVFGDIFFLAFAIGFKFTGGRRRDGDQPAGCRKEPGAPKARRAPRRAADDSLKPMAKVN